MKQVLLLAAIYTLVLYQSQKNAKEKILQAAQRPVAKAASLPLKLYQQYLQLRQDNGNTSMDVSRKGEVVSKFEFAKWNYKN